MMYENVLESILVRLLLLPTTVQLSVVDSSPSSLLSSTTCNPSIASLCTLWLLALCVSGIRSCFEFRFLFNAPPIAHAAFQMYHTFLSTILVPSFIRPHQARGLQPPKVRVATQAMIAAPFSLTVLLSAEIDGDFDQVAIQRDKWLESWMDPTLQ